MSALSELAHAAAPGGRGKRCTCSRRAVFACDEPTTIRDLEDEGRQKLSKCGRAVCDYCVKRVGDLELCQIHARFRGMALTENPVAAVRARQAVEATVGNLYAHDPELNRAARHSEPTPVGDVLEIPDAFASEEA